MVGTALKKYAEGHGMVCDGGYVYGKVNNRYIALVDGTGVKMLQIYLCPPFRADDEILTLQVRQILEDCDRKEYRLIKQNAVNVGNGRAVVVFQDGVGAMARIERYIDHMTPRLEALETGGEGCACCGKPLSDEVRHVLLDDYILPVHACCVEEMIHRTKAIEPETPRGSLARGALGAMLGAALGAIPWVIVYLLGYVAGIAGLLIGFLANFFYEKLGGRKSRARLAIVLVALILGVFLGQAAGVTAVFCQYYDENGGMEVVGLTRGQYILSNWDQVFQSDQAVMLGNMYDRMVENVPEAEQGMLATREAFIQSAWDAEYGELRAEMQREMLVNFGMGLLFGILGCLSLFGKIHQENRKKTARALR